MPYGRPVSQPVLAEKKARRLRELTKPFRFVMPDGRIIDIPAGFRWNGASVPRPVWWVIDPFSPEYEVFSLVHDYLCEQAKSYEDRREADIIGMRVLKETSYVYAPRRALVSASIFTGALWGWKVSRPIKRLWRKIA